MQQLDTARCGQTAVAGVNFFQQASRAIGPAACSRLFDLTQFRIQLPIDARTALSELSRIGPRVFEQRIEGAGAGGRSDAHQDGARTLRPAIPF
jgi:hypothetical protein